VSLGGVRSPRDRCVARHFVRNFTQIILRIVDDGVPDFSVPISAPALRQGRSLVFHRRTERDSDLQSPVCKADYFCVKCSVSFLGVKVHGVYTVCRLNILRKISILDHEPRERRVSFVPIAFISRESSRGASFHASPRKM